MVWFGMAGKVMSGKFLLVGCLGHLVPIWYGHPGTARLPGGWGRAALRGALRLGGREAF